MSHAGGRRRGREGIVRGMLLALLLLACPDPAETPAPPTLDEYLHQSWTLYAEEDVAGIGALTAAEATNAAAATRPRKRMA